MNFFETYISDGGLMRVILIGFVGYTYLKMVKRVNLLNDKIDFLKEKFDDLQKQISENKQKQKDSYCLKLKSITLMGKHSSKSNTLMKWTH